MCVLIQMIHTLGSQRSCNGSLVPDTDSTVFATLLMCMGLLGQNAAVGPGLTGSAAAGQRF